MKAALLQAYGGPEQFTVADVPDPVAAAGEVLVSIAASSLNPFDLYVRQGLVAKMLPLTLPAIIGLDGAGTVVGVGKGVTGYSVGDRVIVHLPVNGKGAHAELAAAPVAGVAKLPANVSFPAGATLPSAGLTGRQVVDALGVRPGARVLVSGALGAVGRVAIQYLHELGATPVAAVRAARLGEGRALAGEALDIGQAPASGSFDYAISAAAAVAAHLAAHVRDGGSLASIVPVPDEVRAARRITVVDVMGHDDPKILQRLADLAGRGKLVLPIAATFGLHELGKAHALLAAGAPGKIVITH